MYTYTFGYQEEIQKGRLGRGHAIGIILVNDEEIPFIPGCVENATTFNFPVLYEEIEANSMQVVTPEPDPIVLKQFIEAAKKLEKRGCRVITSSCGYSANYLPGVAAAVNTPAFLSSLMQVPIIIHSLRPNQKVGIMAFNGRALSSAPALKNCGVDDLSRIIIAGAEDLSEGPKVLQDPTNYSPTKFGEELVGLAKQMVSENPDIGVILLECTIFPPYACAIQKAVRLPVFDFTTMINWIYSAVVRRQFAGFM